MKLTVITAVFNAVNEIEKTILSVVSADLKDVEYIVVDGGSTDGTLNIIGRYRDKISYFISEKDEGISDAFNKGIMAASGDIIGILNAGDTYGDDVIAKILALHDNWDILYGDVRFLEDGYSFIFKPNHQMMTQFMGLAHPGVFVKKETYQRYGLFSKEYKYAMDYEIMLRFYEGGAKFVYMDCLCAEMQMGGTSDIHWIGAYWESFLIKRRYYGNVIPFIFFIRAFLKRVARNLLIIFGLKSIVSAYRKTISPIKKI